MASISSKKRAAGKLSKRCLSLGQRVKIIDKVKKRKKMSCREIVEFEISKTQAGNAVAKEDRLIAEYENFQSEGYKSI